MTKKELITNAEGALKAGIKCMCVRRRSKAGGPYDVVHVHR